MSENHMYADSAFTRVGTMICSRCQKPISDGLFRYKNGGKGFTSVHRACCADDPSWGTVDGEQRRREKHNADFIAACKAFREKWGISDLDDYIDALSRPESK